MTETLATADRTMVRLDVALEDVVVEGNASLLASLISNLVENAVRYNQPNGWVSVVLSSCDRSFTISNSGQFIEADAVPSLFERFSRYEPSRSRANGGFGLGLAIVKAIATMHRAKLDARSRAAGGLIVTVSFPPEI
jgi:two-component system phosphate regulon sensor histidine kinase PhoR